MKENNKSELPGFPWNGKFEDKKEIDHYFAGGKIQCLLCGKRFKSLPTHLIRVHEINPDQYKEKYGLPWRRGLCGVGTSEKLSKNMFDRQKNGFQPPIEIAWKKTERAKRRKDQPFLVKAKINSLKPVIEKLRKYRDQDYKKVLVKMLREKKGLNEVCKDPDMPHFRAVSKYAKRNADYRKKLERTYEQLPYSLQAGAGRLPEKKFIEDLLSLKQSGITVADMTRLLGVSRNLIYNRLKNV
jgi:hypothetical protein